MKLATRLNSFLPEYQNDIEEVFGKLKELGINYVDVNYPEHVANHTSKEMKALLDSYDLTANGVALRFRNEFVNGELGNSDYQIAEKGFLLCKEAVDYCREIGGQVVTLWLGFDGFDYPFQMNYSKVWQQIASFISELADYAKDLKISIEYKPFQPRAYAFIDSAGTALAMIEEIGKENIGLTLDYCHMLMKHENPAYSLDLAASKNKLYGIHLNDGYGLNDDGLMIGTASFLQTVEFLYYAKKYQYDYAFYFDTFPIRERAVAECEQNIQIIKKIDRLIDRIGIEKMNQVVEKNDATEVTQLFLEMIQ